MSRLTHVCDEWVWDGPRRFKCDRWIVGGKCNLHGVSGAKRLYVAPGDTMDPRSDRKGGLSDQEGKVTMSDPTDRRRTS